MKTKISLTSFDLKLIALITMTIDHIGYFLFPQYLWLRFIGRISFPIFAFLIGQGFIHTSNKVHYLYRLAAFGASIEVGLNLLGIAAPTMNIFITLSLGLLALITAELIEQRFDRGIVIYMKVVCLISYMILADTINTDYGSYGVALIVACYYLRNNLRWLFIAMLALPYAYNSWTFFYVQWFSIVSMIFIMLYNGKKGTSLPWYLFYLYYPLHIIILNLMI